MKGCRFKFATSLIVFTVVGTMTPTNAGDLNPPPGAIASTNCTQINQQTITSFPVILSSPGCYILVSNVTGGLNQNGIEISSDDVTLDLNGFALIGGIGSFDGINVTGTGRKNIEIRNGTVTGWPGDGVDAVNANNSQLKDLRASDNLLNGLRVGDSSTVTRCTASDNGLDGITTGNACVVVACAAKSNGRDGIVAPVSSIVDCSSILNADDGFVAFQGSVANCVAANNGGDGIDAGQASTVSDCTTSSNTGDGIRVGNGSFVVRNVCRQNGLNGDGAGIHVAGSTSGSRIEGNNVLLNDRGIDVDFGGNLIIRNSASNNTTNYDIAVGNHYGQIVSLPGAGFTNSNPWANFEF